MVLIQIILHHCRIMRKCCILMSSHRCFSGNAFAGFFAGFFAGSFAGFGGRGGLRGSLPAGPACLVILQGASNFLNLREPVEQGE